MEKNRKHKRSSIITFSESNVDYSALTGDDLEAYNKKTDTDSLLVIYNRNTNEIFGHLIDISLGGIMILCDTPIEKNKIYQLRMNFSLILNSNKNIDFDAENVRIWDNFGMELYFSGFKFVKIDSEDLDIINQLIEKYGVDE